MRLMIFAVTIQLFVFQKSKHLESLNKWLIASELNGVKWADLLQQEPGTEIYCVKMVSEISQSTLGVGVRERGWWITGNGSEL